MASGTFKKNVGAVRPGVYVNFVSQNNQRIAGATRGVVLVPLAGTDYGPAKKFIRLTADAPDAARPMLGHSIYDDHPAMLLIREAFKGASTVIAYILTEGKTAATGAGGGLTATAKYKGSLGNKLTFSVAANPVDGYDVEVSMGGELLERYEGVSNASALSGSQYITFTATGSATLSAVAGVTLVGGTDGTSSNSDTTAFLDASEGQTFDAMCFPFEDTTLHAALKSKIQYLHNDMGKRVQAVAPNFDADFEGIINVTNSYALGDLELTAAQATAFVAGVTAGASKTTSNTYRVVDGATAIVGAKTHKQAVMAIQNGELFFSMSEAGNVVIEYDINSMVNIPANRDASYKKNRIQRVLSEFQKELQLNFPPNKFNNDEDGWEVMEGIGRTILKRFGPTSEGGDGAIRNIDYNADFVVNRELSHGDQTYFDVGIQAVDSAEKLYFTVSTR